MAKVKNDLVPEIKAKQKLNPKVRKNSHCEICYCYICQLKVKNGDVICKDCFMKQKENK